MLAVVLQSEGSCEMEFDGVYRRMVFTLYRSAKLEVPKMWENSLVFVCFWVIPRRLNFMCRRFGTLPILHRRMGIRL